MDRSELLKNVAGNELMQFLGVKIEVATAERVVLTMEVTPKVHQYVGIMNGGISLYLAETAASNVQGFEFGATPTTRRYGLNLYLTF